jgi:hypothetical protein
VFHHLERPGEARGELATGPGHQRLSRSVKNAEEHPVTNGELQWAMVRIVVAFGIVMGLEQANTNVREERVAITKQAVDGVGVR